VNKTYFLRKPYDKQGEAQRGEYISLTLREEPLTLDHVELVNKELHLFVSYYSRKARQLVLLKRRNLLPDLKLIQTQGLEAINYPILDLRAFSWIMSSVSSSTRCSGIPCRYRVIPLSFR